MPSITGAYELPFDPRDRPPTYLVPLAALNHRPTVMLVICKACQHTTIPFDDRAEEPAVAGRRRT